jgi:hypothetical protein
MPNSSVKRATASFGESAKYAAMVSTLLIAPLALLEFNANARGEGMSIDSIAMMGFLWAIGFGIIWLLSLIYNRSQFEILSKSVVLVLFVFMALALAIVWVGVIADQMPCIIGTPNCI